jgi:hypothetical protein
LYIEYSLKNPTSGFALLVLISAALLFSPGQGYQVKRKSGVFKSFLFTLLKKSSSDALTP